MELHPCGRDFFSGYNNCFNFILLKIAGNTGVAAYGLIANLALVGAAIFNGIAQGTQPLVSESLAGVMIRKLLRT